MPHIDNTITADSWSFKSLELTENDYAWLKQNPHNKIYRLKYLSPSADTENFYCQTNIASLRDELQVISSESCLINFDMHDLNAICKPETSLIYVPSLELQPNEEILESLANHYQVSTVISLYSIHPFFTLDDFTDSLELINKHIKANTYRSGVRIITDCDAMCALLLVLEN